MFTQRWYCLVIVSITVMAMAISARAQDAEPNHIRGEIIKIKRSSVVVKTDAGKTMSLETPDNLTYIVKVRPNVRFHDTEKIRKDFPQVAGRELTAEDVRYSIERQLNTESPKAGLYYRMGQWETLDKIELIDPMTIKFVTKRPTAPFIHYLADTHNFIIARELVDPDEDDMDSPDKMIGTGPFILDKFLSEGGPSAIIGSSPLKSEIALPDPDIDPQHAMLIGAGSHLVLKDMSMGGTYINGRKNERTQLADGQSIRAGNTAMVYHERR